MNYNGLPAQSQDNNSSDNYLGAYSRSQTFSQQTQEQPLFTAHIDDISSFLQCLSMINDPSAISNFKTNKKNSVTTETLAQLTIVNSGIKITYNSTQFFCACSTIKKELFSMYHINEDRLHNNINTTQFSRLNISSENGYGVIEPNQHLSQQAMIRQDLQRDLAENETVQIGDETYSRAQLDSYVEELDKEINIIVSLPHFLRSLNLFQNDFRFQQFDQSMGDRGGSSSKSSLKILYNEEGSDLELTLIMDTFEVTTKLKTFTHSQFYSQSNQNSYHNDDDDDEIENEIRSPFRSSSLYQAQFAAFVERQEQHQHRLVRQAEQQLNGDNKYKLTMECSTTVLFDLFHNFVADLKCEFITMNALRWDSKLPPLSQAPFSRDPFGTSSDDLTTTQTTSTTTTTSTTSSSSGQLKKSGDSFKQPRILDGSETNLKPDSLFYIVAHVYNNYANLTRWCGFPPPRSLFPSTADGKSYTAQPYKAPLRQYRCPETFQTKYRVDDIRRLLRGLGVCKSVGFRCILQIDADYNLSVRVEVQFEKSPQGLTTQQQQYSITQKYYHTVEYSLVAHVGDDSMLDENGDVIPMYQQSQDESQQSQSNDREALTLLGIKDIDSLLPKSVKKENAELEKEDRLKALLRLSRIQNNLIPLKLNQIKREEEELEQRQAKLLLAQQQYQKQQLNSKKPKQQRKKGSTTTNTMGDDDTYNADDDNEDLQRPNKKNTKKSNQQMYQDSDEENYDNNTSNNDDNLGAYSKKTSKSTKTISSTSTSTDTFKLKGKIGFNVATASSKQQQRRKLQLSDESEEEVHINVNRNNHNSKSNDTNKNSKKRQNLYQNDDDDDDDDDDDSQNTYTQNEKLKPSSRITPVQQSSKTQQLMASSKQFSIASTTVRPSATIAGRINTTGKTKLAHVVTQSTQGNQSESDLFSDESDTYM